MVFGTKCGDLVLVVVLRLRRGEEGSLGRFKGSLSRFKLSLSRLEGISSTSRKFPEVFKFLVDYIRVLLKSGGKRG